MGISLEQQTLKSSFNMKVTLVQKDEDGKLRVIDEKWVKERKKNFLESLQEDRDNNINHTIEFVAGAPSRFVLNTIYIRHDGRQVYVYVEKEAS